MNGRYLASLFTVIVVLLLLTVPITSQAQTTAEDGWAVPRTPWVIQIYRAYGLMPPLLPWNAHLSWRTKSSLRLRKLPHRTLPSLSTAL